MKHDGKGCPGSSSGSSSSLPRVVNLYTTLAINILADDVRPGAENYLKGVNAKCYCRFHFLQAHQACKSFICNNAVRNCPHKHLQEKNG